MTRTQNISDQADDQQNWENQIALNTKAFLNKIPHDFEYLANFRISRSRRQFIYNIGQKIRRWPELPGLHELQGLSKKHNFTLFADQPKQSYDQMVLLTSFGQIVLPIC